MPASGAFVCVFLPTQSTTRWAQGCRPRSKQQVGFEKEDQDLVSALAASKNASCCRCAKRRAGTRLTSTDANFWSKSCRHPVPSGRTGPYDFRKTPAHVVQRPETKACQIDHVEPRGLSVIRQGAILRRQVDGGRVE